MKSGSSTKEKTEKKGEEPVLTYEAYTEIDFAEVNAAAIRFADHIKKNIDDIADVLLEYESYEVVRDETDRTLDILTHLEENKEYFKLRIGSVAAFLPRNQPLYALTCFTIVPSLMASEVHFRIPKSMQGFLPKLLTILNVKEFFPNLYPTDDSHQVFLKKHTALHVHPKTKETLPVTDAVIFTGTPARADQLRSVFDSRTLFITNGSGHNPVIVSNDAKLEDAVEAVLTLQLYNQGQDCAAPNAILVHKDIFEAFSDLLHEKLTHYKVGEYRDKECQIGPISDPFDLVRIEDILIRHKAFIDKRTPGIIRAHDGIVEPTIITKPLRWGGNFTESFAPLIFLQEYEKDEDLTLYFDDPEYFKNAMYVTVYGTSAYAMSLIGKTVKNKLMHDASTMLFNTHLHVPGVERGTKPYGGYGYGASNLAIRGSGYSKPTLPQRDIFEHVAEPIIKDGGAAYREAAKEYTGLEEKNIEKLLRMSNQLASRAQETEFAAFYMDMTTLGQDNGRRYRKVDPEATYRLLSHPNVQYISDLTPEFIRCVRKVRELIHKKPNDPEEFKTALYATVGDHSSQEERQTQQRALFGHVYNLLFGKKFGPKLTTFLWEIDPKDVDHLLDV